MTDSKFEGVVLKVAKRHLDDDERAEFFKGTLFLDCAESASRKIFSDLFMMLGGKVQVHRVGPEFAIDFV